MTGSLFLTPPDPSRPPPARDTVVDALAALKIIGKSHGPHSWLAGDDLLRHVTFAGCSPYLEFTPPADGSRAFCHVSLLGPYDTPRMVAGPHTVKPRCASCKTRVAAWEPLAEQFARDPQLPWTCPSCEAQSDIARLRWRQHAGFGRLLVQIHSVFPAEGVPSDELLEALGTATDAEPWSYAWAASVT